MSKKVKIILIAIIVGAAVYTYRSEIKSFISSMTVKESNIEADAHYDKSSYEYYYNEYKLNNESDTSSNWNIYQED